MSKLPRRDIWLLPLIAVLTVVGMLVGAEIVARAVWPEQEVNACRIPDRALGSRYRPNCSSTMKTAEGPWYTNTYNECGYRTPTSCGAVPVGTRRIALIGTSLSEGFLVEYPNTVGARLGADLTAMCGAPVEVQNLGAQGHTGHRMVLRMDEALTLHPDVVVLLVVPYDVESQLNDAYEPTNDNQAKDLPAFAAQPSADNEAETGFQRRFFLWLGNSRAITIAQHFLFRNRSIYLPLYLQYGDKADFLRPPFTVPWQLRLHRFERLVGDLADRAHQSGVPFTLVFVPQMAETVLMTGIPVPSGVDPRALPDAIAAIARRHDIGFIDSSEALRAEPKPELLYYQVNGHLSGRGEPIVARYVAQRLRDEVSGPFANCSVLQAGR